MRRREYIQLIAGSVVAGPLAALAQQPTLLVIVSLATASLGANATRLRAFREGLAATGYAITAVFERILIALQRHLAIFRRHSATAVRRRWQPTTPRRSRGFSKGRNQ